MWWKLPLHSSFCRMHFLTFEGNCLFHSSFFSPSFGFCWTFESLANGGSSSNWSRRRMVRWHLYCGPANNFYALHVHSAQLEDCFFLHVFQMTYYWGDRVFCTTGYYRSENGQQSTTCWGRILQTLTTMFQCLTSSVFRVVCPFARLFSKAYFRSLSLHALQLNGVQRPFIDQAVRQTITLAA